MPASSAGAVPPTTRPTVPPGPQVAARRATRGGVARPGTPAVGVRLDHQVLELPRPGVGGPAQDVGEPVGPFEERGDRLLAQVRVDRDRVGAQGVEEGHGLPGRGRPDVAALRVGKDRQVGREAARIRSRAAIPADPKASKNARLGLIAAACGAAASTTRRREPLDAGEVAREAVGQGRRVRVEAETEDGPGGRRSRGQALEVGAGHSGGRARAGGRARGGGGGRRGGRGRELARRG